MQVSWIPPSHPLKEILPPHVPLFLLQLKIQLMRARSPMKMLFALSLSAMRILTWTISQASIYVDWLENLPFKVCILTSRTPMAASQNRYLSGHNYRWNATSGNLNAHQIVSHPFNQQFVSRSVAWDLVRPACARLQALLHQEQLALNYPLVDENPLTDEDRAWYTKTMRASVDWFVLFVLLFSLPVW